VDPAVAPYVRRAADASGLAREDGWAPGEPTTPPFLVRRGALPLDLPGEELGEDELTHLLEARGEEAQRVFAAADALRREVCGDEVTYVVTRNIQYTNVCYFRCGFCAFSKGRLAANLRGAPYLVPLEEIVRRTEEAWERGATEVCLQGGIHPAFTGEYYADVVRAIKEAVPGIHVHAFSALEVWQGAETLGLELGAYLARLRDLGLGSLPGTAAEVLDDEVRQIICPDKVTTEQWLQVHEAAHRVGLRSNVTLMFGHADTPRSWARHLLHARELARRTGGFTEFVPLPFVPMEAPIYLQGRARRGPTFREALLVHAVGRLALHPFITNVQASWVKLGPEGVREALGAGVNDLGGTLMNESISRSAGAAFGEEMPPERMEALIRSANRIPRQRTTLYGDPPEERIRASFAAPPLAEPVSLPVKEAGLVAPPRLVRPGLAGKPARASPLSATTR
jgi:FO synthase